MNRELPDTLPAAYPSIQRVRIALNSEGDVTMDEVVLDLRHVRDAYIYCRSAAFDEAALEHQQDICGRMAEENKWVVKGVYVDNGVSGRTEHRDGLDEMLAALNDAEPNSTIVIAADRARLYRHIALERKLHSTLEERGVAVAFASERVESGL
jgi:DNA invertase Pin-like site-specific DNA recombinase